MGRKGAHRFVQLFDNGGVALLVSQVARSLAVLVSREKKAVSSVLENIETERESIWLL